MSSKEDTEFAKRALKGWMEGLKEADKLRDGIMDIIKQKEINDYKDSKGHALKMNKAYIDLVGNIKSLGKEK